MLTNVHVNGCNQYGTPWADGTASISQCAINPEETFIYRFQVDKVTHLLIIPQIRTYFYHGHYGMQRAAGLYGSLIVEVADGEEEPFHYDGEFNLLLSDWYHQSIYDQMVGLSSKPFRWIGEPQNKTGKACCTMSYGIFYCVSAHLASCWVQSLLINGRGQYNCSLAAHLMEGSSACKLTSKDCAPVVLRVLPGKTYRLRVASTTSLSSLNLAIGVSKPSILYKLQISFLNLLRFPSRILISK
ncbi:hypothetical protein B296_00026974 [Ensete ventricosum]|uniref:Plastocyanin-like domain-containing protein n=1 Tax=Ensete ventricosum TaxID=4639 RepID=A0A426ZEW6_ENSVE|nr:hypothetical protein B296_00026974 [Ensete ventricosum]